MTFERLVARLLLADGLAQLRTGPAYLMLSGQVIDLSGLTAARRLALERCLAVIEGCRNYVQLCREMAGDGALSHAMARLPAGQSPGSAELALVLRDVAWRRGLREGAETYDPEVLRRWFDRRHSLIRPERESAAAERPGSRRRRSKAPRRRGASEEQRGETPRP